MSTLERFIEETFPGYIDSAYELSEPEPNLFSDILNRIMDLAVFISPPTTLQ